MQKQTVYVVIDDEEIVSIHESKPLAYKAAVNRIDESDLFREVMDLVERGFLQTRLDSIIDGVFDALAISVEESVLIRE